jgi:hypothetical protein
VVTIIAVEEDEIPTEKPILIILDKIKWYYDIPVLSGPHMGKAWYTFKSSIVGSRYDTLYLRAPKGTVFTPFVFAARLNCYSYLFEWIANVEE